jgi:hypothetical protein
VVKFGQLGKLAQFSCQKICSKQKTYKLGKFVNSVALAKPFARNTGHPGNIGLTGRANKGNHGLLNEIPRVLPLD